MDVQMQADDKASNITSVQPYNSVSAALQFSQCSLTIQTLKGMRANQVLTIT